MKENQDKIVDRIYMTLPVLMHKLYHDLVLPSNEYSLNKTHFKVLLIIHIRQNPNITKVCRHMNMRKGSMTTVIDKLIELDLVMREINPHDRREVNLKLTGSGEKLVKYYLSLSHKHVKEKLSALSKEDMEKFKRAIDDMNDIVQKL
jgi:MarR family transcriptional regulator, organic hydroperoxide resistance regulator